MILRRIFASLLMGAILAGCIPTTPGQERVSAKTPFDLPTISVTVLPGSALLPQSANGPVTQALPAQNPPVLSQIPTRVSTIAPAIPTEMQPAQPTLTPTSLIPLLGQSCLVGTWQVTNIAQSMSASLAQNQPGLQLQRVDGQAIYQFSADGNMKLTYQRLSYTLSGTVENHPVTARQSLDGTATAHYDVDAGNHQIVLTNFGDSDIQIGLDINGQRLVEGSLPIWQAFTSGLAGQTNSSAAPPVLSSRANATCTVDKLVIQAAAPAPGPEVDLKRVQ